MVMVKVPDALKVSRTPEELVLWDQVKWPWKVSRAFVLVLVLDDAVVVEEEPVLELEGMLVDC
jgi:hypothetical protein